jgi:uncharacterized repeat protein (TIGR03806 family)
MAILRRHLVTATLALAGLAACGSGSDSDVDKNPVLRPTPAAPEQPWSTLSEWHLFRDIERQIPAEGVIPYDVISVLYADDAEKYRFLYVPPGQKIAWKDTDPWQLPVGTILVKTFGHLKDERDPALGRQLLETRLLVREPEAWVAHIYEYTGSQREAEHLRIGDTIELDRIDRAGATRHEQYNVPDEFDCQSCHGKLPDMIPLGPRTRQLERTHDYGNGPENQIDHLTALGLFDTTPPTDRQHLIDPYGDGPVFERARSYLDANCAHCHSEGRRSDSTGYWINYERTDPTTGDPQNWGVCKFPTSAGNASGGLTYDIVPGNPDASIVVYRVGSTLAKVKMPPLLTRHPDERGVQLLREWILAMPADDCK